MEKSHLISVLNEKRMNGTIGVDQMNDFHLIFTKKTHFANLKNNV
jgi:hypothetical protein